MWQAANLVETEGPAGNSVAVSATSQMRTVVEGAYLTVPIFVPMLLQNRS
jgi:hypothetical protein